uniref:Secreted protein n=1 Tax=Heterorhabditis bacteriophora TaxID=37862 RepID=A0A1I7WJ28_HETBA
MDLFLLFKTTMTKMIIQCCITYLVVLRKILAPKEFLSASGASATTLSHFSMDFVFCGTRAGYGMYETAGLIIPIIS